MNTSEAGQLRVGCRVRLSGGYGMRPKWLACRDAHEGECVAFIAGQNAEPAAVVCLDENIEVEGASGNIVVLELRYEGAKWGEREVVHIELCSFMPQNLSWNQRRKGVWIESHASYEILDPGVSKGAQGGPRPV